VATSTLGRGRPARSAGRVLPVLVIMVMLGSCAAPASHPAGGSSAVPATDGRLAVSVRLGGEVDGLAAGGGYLWAYVRDTGALVRVDQRTGQARRFMLGAWRGMPVVVAAGPRGLWLANQHSTRPDLVLIDLHTGRVVARPRLPGGVGPIAGLVAAYGSLWILVPDGAFPPGWRVLRLNPATNRVNGITAGTPGTQLAGHTAAIWASLGQIWVTGSMPVIVRLDPRTLALHVTPVADLSEGLVFGGGHAWALDMGRPQLAVVDPLTGQVARTVTTPAPSTTGDDYVAAGPDLLWVFRGPRLSQLNPATRQIMTSARVDPVAPAFYSPAVVAGRGLWYLAQTGHGIVLDKIAPAP
jgi:streptogramin lyase